MQNQISVFDLLAYFNERLQLWQAELEKTKKHYAEEKAKYNKTIWHRWFGCEYEDSTAGDCSWLGYNWDTLSHAAYHIRNLENAIKVCEYHANLGQQTLAFEFDNLYASQFYNWMDARTYDKG